MSPDALTNEDQSPLGFSPAQKLNGGIQISDTAGAHDKNDIDGGEMGDNDERKEMLPNAKKESDPEVLDHFEFLTKTAEKLKDRVTNIEKLVKETEDKLDGQMSKLKDKIDNEKKQWITKHPEILQGEGIN